MVAIRLIVGLGNPGREYEKNRHNVGWMAVDAIHARHRFGPWKKRFSAEVADGTLGADKALLIKPLTYMNESGRAVGEAARFLKAEPKDAMSFSTIPGKSRIRVRRQRRPASASGNSGRAWKAALSFSP